MISKNLQYTGGGLDRCANRRKDLQWLNAQLDHPKALFIATSNSILFLIKDNKLKTEVAYQNKEMYQEVTQRETELVFLGLNKGIPLFVCDLGILTEDEQLKLFDKASFKDLRYIGPQMNPSESARLAYARAMVHWHRNHLFCSRCGSKTISKFGGHQRSCSNSTCDKESFPRTDPAVIMLVEHQDKGGINRCLLGRHTKSPQGAYSTLAGFVDPGETLEEAVIREVKEEAGIIVKSATYQASQPWPFPSSLMLAFRANAISTKINIDTEELSEARWFTADELIDAGEWGDKQAGLKISRKDSIARFLIDKWVLDNS